MMKKLFLFLFISFAFIFLIKSVNSTPVLCEYITTTSCQACPPVSETLYDIYSSHDYPFYYISMVTDKNKEAEDTGRQYNIFGYPTAVFNGGYVVVFGKHERAEYINAIEKCMERESKIIIQANSYWSREGLSIDVNITNQYDSYFGRLKIYVVEPVSNWRDYNGNKFKYAFIGYAMDKNFSMKKGKESFHALWKANMTDNMLVIVAVFNGNEEIRYSDPPFNKHSFKAHFLDAVVASKPKKDMPPSLYFIEKPEDITGYKNVTFKWNGSDDHGNVLFSYKLEGYEEWHDWSNIREAKYENLKDGSYVFKLRGKDNMGQIKTISYSFKVDTSKPYVIYTHPKNNEKDFPPYEAIIIKFSHPMNKNIIKIKFEPNATYSVIWKNSREMQIHANLKYETIYSISISGERKSGQKMDEYSFSFQTSPPDITQPEVKEAKPFYEEYYNGIYIKFSKPMDRVIIKGIEITPYMPYTYQWKENDTLLIIKLRYILLGNYKLKLTEYMQDKYGNKLKPFEMEFYITKPKVVANTAENSNLLMNEPIEITFSHPMNKTSVEKGIEIHPDCNFSIKWINNRTIKIIGKWKYEGYRMEIKNAKDDRNISMENYSFSFYVPLPASPPSMQNGMPSFAIYMVILSILFIIMRKRK